MSYMQFSDGNHLNTDFHKGHSADCMLKVKYLLENQEGTSY